MESVEDPVFIVGGGRSGSSLLYRVVQCHPRFRPRELELTETHIVPSAMRAYQYSSAEPDRLLRFMLRRSDIYEDFLDRIQPVATFQKRINPFNVPARIADRREAWRHWWWRISRASEVVATYFRLAKKARGCSRLVEKSPAHIHWVSELRRVFPDAKMLFIHRHPVDVFSSAQRRAEVTGTRNWEWECDEFCRGYRKSVGRAVEHASERPSGFRLVSYEAFTSRPEEEWRSICDFLEVEFEPGALSIEPEDYQDWEPDPHLFRPITPDTKDWRDFISVAEAETIEDRCEDLIAGLGYERYTGRTPAPGSAR